jgi:hypothetical protein
VSGRPLLSVICPTIGRATLPRTLASIREQAPQSEAELIVVGDTHAGTYRDALARVPLVCAMYGARYLELAGAGHCVGQMQRQYGMQQARGEWLAFSQDDGRWNPGAWDAIRFSLGQGELCPRLFRVEVRPGFTVWKRAERLAEGEIDADGLVCRNDPARLGTWGLRQAGDYDMIAVTVALWGGQAQWEPFVIAQGRPDAE